MQTCAQCGREFSAGLWAGLFGRHDVCPECRNARMDAVRKYVEKIKELGRDRYLDVEEERQLEELRRSLRLSDEDLKQANRMLENLRRTSKKLDIERYEAKLREVGADGYLDPEEETELARLREELGLTGDDIAHTVGELLRLKRLTAIKNGQLPVVEADIMLKRGEVCHYETEASLVEEKSVTRYVGGSQGVSIRIAKGVYYRVGGFKGMRLTDTVKEVTDRGTLYVTNKRVVFVGAKKNVTYQIGKLVGIKKWPDAIQFQVEKEARPRYFVIKDPDAVDATGLIVSQVAAR